MDFALRVAERVTMMHNGSIVAEGTPDEIRANELVHDLYLGRSMASSEPLLQIRDLECLLRPVRTRCRASTSTSAPAGRRSRPQRHGQDHAVQRDHGPDAATCAARSARGPGARRPGAVRDRRRRHRLRAAGPPRVPVAEHRRAPAHIGGARATGRGHAIASTSFSRARRARKVSGEQLSGGEQQMLVIGRALSTNPRLLIMDEPSEGLAPTVVERTRSRRSNRSSTSGMAHGASWSRTSVRHGARRSHGGDGRGPRCGRDHRHRDAQRRRGAAAVSRGHPPRGRGGTRRTRARGAAAAIVAARNRRKSMRGKGGGSSGRRVAAVLATSVLVLVVAACGSSKDGRSATTAAATTPAATTPAASGTDTGAAASGGTITIGHLATCEGPFAGFYHSMVNGTRLAMLEAGGTLADPSDLKAEVTGVKAGGKEHQDRLRMLRRHSRQGDRRCAPPGRGGQGRHRPGPALRRVRASRSRSTAKTHPECHVHRRRLRRTGHRPSDARAGITSTASTPRARSGWPVSAITRTTSSAGARSSRSRDDYGFPYSQVAGFLAEFCSLGGTIEKKGFWPPLGTTDYSSYASQIPTSGIDGFFMAIGGSGTLSFLNAYQGIKADEKLADKMIGGTITVDPDLLKGLGDRVEGVVTAGPTPPDSTAPAWTAYADLSKQYFPDEAPSSIFYIAWYDGMKVLLADLNATTATCRTTSRPSVTRSRSTRTTPRAARSRSMRTAQQSLPTTSPRSSRIRRPASSSRRPSGRSRRSTRPSAACSPAPLRSRAATSRRGRSATRHRGSARRRTVLRARRGLIR